MTRVALVTAEPMRSPKAMAVWFFLIALSSKASSGREVPTETIKRPMKSGGRFKIVARDLAQWTVNSAEATRRRVRISIFAREVRIFAWFLGRDFLGMLMVAWRKVVSQV